MSLLHWPVKSIVRSKRLPQKIGMVLALALLLVVNHSCMRRRESRKQTTETRPEVSSPFPTQAGLVNDYANLFDPESKKRLESLLAELKQKSDIEFAVVTIDRTGGQPIFDYSLALARTWKVGTMYAKRWVTNRKTSTSKDNMLQVLRSTSTRLFNDCKSSKGLR